VTVDGVLDCPLDLLDYSVQLQLQRITMYTLYNTSVELDTRLATVPQPAFHYNILLASLAIDHFFSEDSNYNSVFQQLPGYQPELDSLTRSEVYDLWSDCRGDRAFGIGCLAITRETGTLRSRACTLPSNVYSWRARHNILTETGNVFVPAIRIFICLFNVYASCVIQESTLLMARWRDQHEDRLPRLM
jgi:hypothetical protein